MKSFKASDVASLAVLSCFAALAIPAAPAYAQATRTWVSGGGDDVNTCSRDLPCKTFAGAIGKTAAGGEIDCLDPAGYGTLTITKSITIDCTGTLGSTLNSGGINGFVINDSATEAPGTAEVKLRGLTIDGAGTTPGLNGIRFISGRSLIVEDVFIQNSKSGHGISFQPSTPARLYVTNSLIVDNGSGFTGGGILIKPTGAAGNASVSLNNVHIENNGNIGIRVDSEGNTSNQGISVSIEASSITGSANHGISLNTAGTNPIRVTVIRSRVSTNAGAGLAANGAQAVMRVTGSTITGNSTGVFASNGGAIGSFGDNVLVSNPTSGPANDGGFSSVGALQ